MLGQSGNYRLDFKEILNPLVYKDISISFYVVYVRISRSCFTNPASKQ